MVNCNPETVSTDYDTSDRLYFEPLTAEDFIEIVHREQSNGEVLGVVLQFGGQTPLKLAAAIENAGIPVLGTTPDAIDLAEDRERFQKLLNNCKLSQPENGMAGSSSEAMEIIERIGFPIVIRPSYVLGGRGMEIIFGKDALQRYLKDANWISRDNPVLLDSYLRDAIEIDVDALADNQGNVHVAGIMEHIEEAGIHSGDSACSLPPYSLSEDLVEEIKRQTIALAQELKVVGLMNVQYAITNNKIYVLEVNPRASRTVPFVAKATGVPVAKVAARIMAGENLDVVLQSYPLVGSGDHVAIKEAVFPFARFSGVDTLLGPEMKSTGEVMGIDVDFARAFAKSQLGAGQIIPVQGTAFLSVKDSDKPAIVLLAEQLVEMGFKLLATEGTAKSLKIAGMNPESINKVMHGQPHIVDAMTDGRVDIVFNTAGGVAEISDSGSLREAALINQIPYYTTVAGARAAVAAISALRTGTLEVAPLQSYLASEF
jgi:carbamoyl-phosphate synthase large subunit